MFLVKNFTQFISNPHDLQRANATIIEQMIGWHICQLGMLRDHFKHAHELCIVAMGYHLQTYCNGRAFWLTGTASPTSTEMQNRISAFALLIAQIRSLISTFVLLIA